MRRLALVLLLAAGLGALAAQADAQMLPSAETRNAPNSLVLPIAFDTPPVIPETRSYEQLLALWQAAGDAYGIPWHVLAAINKIESDFGRNMGPSSAGALGWMQFMPGTWFDWGVDANGDGVASPWNPEDAVYSAARYLAAAGAREDLYRGIFAYNHADWYVQDVLELAALFGAGDLAAMAAELPLFGSSPQTVFTVDDLELRLERARRAVTAAQRAIVRLEGRLEELEWSTLEAERQAGDPALTDEVFTALEAEITLLLVEQDEVVAALGARRDELAAAEAARALLEEEATAVTFSRTVGRTLAGAQFAGDFVFPVGGGPGVVSVSHDHHDYPAADIVAPEGSPLYALASGVVIDSWPLPQGRCGIGLTLQLDLGQTYTYCHLAYLDPGVVAGAAFAAGAPVGLVGSTGNSTGPHLHLQLDPTLSYPQDEAWFQGFAGTAFSWSDERAPATAAPQRSFAVVDEPTLDFTR